MPKLVVASGENAGTAYAIEVDQIVLGRHKDCQFNQIFQQIGGVSRRHVQITRRGNNRYYAEDLGSRNGTLLNGGQLKESTELVDGDELSVCGVTLQFVAPDSEQQPTAPITMIARGIGREPFIRAAVPVADRSSVEEVVVEDAKRKFKALVRLLGNTGQSLEVDEILDNLLAGLFDVFETADHGFVALRETEQSDVTARAVRNRHQTFNETLRISQTIVERALTSKEAILSLNAVADPRFDSTSSILAQNMRTLMCAPLVGRDGKAVGVIQLETVDAGGGFVQEDLELLASITPHAATALDYARIHAEALRRQALQHDLDFARQIQRNFLPQAEPQLEGYRFFSHYEAANEVGGDYFDYIQLSDNRLCVIVADVAGKGISAGLLMSKFAGEFKYLLSRDDSLSSAVTYMNDALYADVGMSRFITLAAVVVDGKRHELTLVNAGHMDPLLRRHDHHVDILDVDEKGTPIGMFPDRHYKATRVSLGAGDSVVMFTDGLNEAMRADQSLYGNERIRQRVSDGPGDAVGLGNHLLEDVKQFVGDYPQSDDLCLLCIHRNLQ